MNDDMLRRQRRADRLRAVLYFTVAGVFGAGIGATLLLWVMGPLPAVLAMVFATASAAVSAAILSSALASAREAGRMWKVLAMGGAVPVLAYVLFAVGYSLAEARSLERFLNDFVLMLDAGITLSPLLVSIGATTGWFYTKGGAAPEA